MRVIVGFMLLLVFVGIPVAEAADSKKALCHVCRVMEGEDEAENVKASRTHEGVEYGFCSKACAKKFDEDPMAFIPPVIPRPAPAFALADMTGADVSTETLEGKVVLVDFWATWCQPCRKSMPELQAIQDEFAERGFTVVGISIDEAKHEKRVKDFVEKHEIRYPIAMDVGETPAWNDYMVKAVPAAFLIDRDGQIVAQWTGKTADMDALRAQLDELLEPQQP